MLAEVWRAHLILDAGVRAEPDEQLSWRGRALLRVRHDHLDLALEANHTPTAPEARAADRSEVRASVTLNLQELLPVDSQGLERFTLRTEVGHARASGLWSEERWFDLDLRLNLRVALHERLRVAAELAWVGSETSDPGTGWRHVERAWQLDLAGQLGFAAALLSPGVAIGLDPATGELHDLGVRVRWQQPLGSFADGHLEARYMRVREEPDSFVLEGEWGRTLLPKGRFSVKPQLLWRAAAPLRFDLTLRSNDWVFRGLALNGTVRFGGDASGATDWEGSVVLHGRLPVGEAGVDLRAELKLLEAGWGAEVAARGSFDLGPSAELAWEAKGLLSHELLPSVEVGVRYAYRFELPIGRRQNVGHVEGTLQRRDGTPVAGVGLQVGGRLVATTADGRFRLPNLTVGDHYLSFTAGTLPAGMLLVPSGPTRVGVSEGETTHLELVMVAAATVVGRVTFVPSDLIERTGVALVGSGDLALDARHVAGVGVVLRRHTTVRRAVSDARGAFHFADLEPGTYTLEVEAAGLPSTLRFGPLPTTVEVAEGARLPLELPLEPVLRVVQVTEGGVIQPR